MSFDFDMPPSSSIWTDHHRTPRTPLSVGVPARSSVVVIGAGICGLVTAAMLVDHGVDVTVIEARTSADSVTARSSAKVSVLQELTAARIAAKRGDRAALTYIRAQQFGLDWIQQRVATRGIECSWEQRNAVTYIGEKSSDAEFATEVDLLRRAGVDATATSQTGLPFPIRRAVTVVGQAQFDPLAFLDSLIVELVDSGNVVLDGVRATGVRRSRRSVTVETNGGNIEAGHVVVTTGLPFLDRGLFFARAEPQSSYVIACETDSKPEPHMYLSADGAKRSVRPATTKDGTDVLLVGGEGHKTGQGGNTEQHYATLAAWANSHFGLVRITHRFMAQDFVTPDHVPFVGPVTPGNDQVLVATGMNKWGFTNGAAAAAVNVARIIKGATPPWSDLYSTTRLPVTGLPDLVKANGNVAAHLVGGWAGAIKRDVTPEAGQGNTRRDGMKITATSADRCNGELTSVDGICPHIGAILTWNPAEESWDCPLHGSRFEADGQLLHGPATSDLARRDR